MPSGTQHVPYQRYVRYVSSGTHIVPVCATWHSARIGTWHLALSTYTYLPSGTQIVPLRATWHSALSYQRYVRYVSSGTQIVPVYATWHSARIGTCHLTLSTYWYVPPGTQHVPVLAIWHSDRTATCHLALSTIPPTVCPVRVIWHSDRPGTCHLAFSTYRYISSGTHIVPVRAIWHAARTVPTVCPVRAVFRAVIRQVKRIKDQQIQFNFIAAMLLCGGQQIVLRVTDCFGIRHMVVTKM